MKKKLTPEDKLLEVIENSDSGINDSRAINKETYNYLEKIKETFVSFWEEGKIKKFFNLNSLNKLILVVCVVFAFFLVFNFNRQKSIFRKRLIDFEVNSQKIDNHKEDTDQLDIPIEDSLQKAKIRNIFSFIPPKQKVQVAIDDTPRDILQKIDSLKVVGIIWSQTNPQVMIEDSKNNSTSLLNVGDKIKGIRIKSIFMDKVVLEAEGKEWELR